MVGLKKLNTELPCDSAAPLLGIHLKELKAGSQRDVCISTIHSSQRAEQPKHSSADEQTKGDAYTPKNVRAALRREELCSVLHHG